MSFSQISRKNDHTRVLVNTLKASVGLHFSRGSKTQLDTHYTKTWSEQNSQEELIRLGQWAVQENFVDILKAVKTNVCYMHDCGVDARCVE